MGERTCSVPGCGKSVASRRMCWKHYYRLHRHGNVNYVGRIVYGTPEERFWAKVNKDGPVPDYRPDLGPCWLWQGAVNGDGYGTFAAPAGQSTLAHRWAYMHFVGGNAPEHDHLCRVRHCVNYERHLEPVTTAENIARSPIHYGARTHCKNGHPFTSDNTMLRSDGGRRCRICKQNYSDRSRARKHAANGRGG